ncbi:ADP-ribosyltransferase domain-containing protein [Roseivirga sp. BDSF3-8]|uniref:ADP-ribosyltransferase domain-containing protein n=1 Tax=Roseivirga sp. BDSF3-8 TaxID=3241598 RepID=UPI0035323A22
MELACAEQIVHYGRLYVELSDNGVLDLVHPDDIYLKTGLSVDPERHTHTGFYLDIPYADKEGTAIRLWAYTFEDFEKLLHRIGFHIPSIAHPYYLDIYKQAITNADGDCDKLDVIYETIPPFVASELPDESLYQALVSLSDCIMDDGLYVNGTNEEIAVINILKAYSDKQTLYQKLYDTPELVHKLYAGLDGEDLSTFVNILWELSNQYGPGQSEHFIRLGEVPAEVYEVTPGYRGKQYILVDGTRFNNKNNLSLHYCIGRRNFGLSAQSAKDLPGIADVNPLDLVKLHTGSQEEVLLVPALFVYYHGTQSNREHLMGVISTGSNLLGLGAASKILLTRGAPALLRMLAVIEIGKLALDEAMERPDIQQAIRDEGGDWFVDNYYWISITVDLTVFSADVLTDLVTNGRKASKALRAQGESQAADRLDEVIEQAEEAKRVRGESMTPEALFAGYPHLNSIRSQKLIAKIKGLNLDGTTLSKLDETLSDASLLAKFEAEPGLVEAWKLLENSARRTDIKTLKFFSDPAVLESYQEIIIQNIHTTFPEIPFEELTAIRHYTTNAHRDLNKALRGEIPMTDEYRAFKELLNSGMEKLPKYNGDKVFRGIKGEEAALAKTWNVGDEIPFSDFKSSSTELSTALKPAFMEDVLYEIVNPKGYNICDVSCLPHEAEILFKSGTKFEVVNIKDGFKFLDPKDPLTVLAEGRKVLLKLIE